MGTDARSLYVNKFRRLISCAAVQTFLHNVYASALALFNIRPLRPEPVEYLIREESLTNENSVVKLIIAARFKITAHFDGLILLPNYIFIYDVS